MNSYSKVEIITFGEEDVRESMDARQVAYNLGTPFVKQGHPNVKGDIYLLVETLTKVFIRFSDGVQRRAPITTLTGVLGLGEEQYRRIELQNEAEVHKIEELLDDADTTRTLEFVNDALRTNDLDVLEGYVLTACWNRPEKLCVLAVSTKQRVQYVVLRVSPAVQPWEPEGAVLSIKRFIKTCKGDDNVSHFGMVQVFKKLERYLGRVRVVS